MIWGVKTPIFGSTPIFSQMVVCLDFVFVALSTCVCALGPRTQGSSEVHRGEATSCRQFFQPRKQEA